MFRNDLQMPLRHFDRTYTSFMTLFPFHLLKWQQCSPLLYFICFTCSLHIARNIIKAYHIYDTFTQVTAHATIRS